MANPPLKIRWAIFIALTLFALAVRLPQLGERPMHTDESINAYITGELLAGQSFHYDPQDRHGPALFLLAKPIAQIGGAKTFSDLTETELRLSTVLTGAATVLLFGAAVEMFGFVACFIAALLFAVAPLPVYYHRYFIHESLFVWATLGLILSGWRAQQKKSIWLAVLAGFFAALMLTCKETAPIHFFALLLSAIGVRVWSVRIRSRAATSPEIVRRDNCLFPVHPKIPKMILAALLTFVFFSVLLFTWFGQNWRALADLIHAVSNFTARAGGEGHQKPFWYYAKLLSDGWSGAIILLLALCGIASVVSQFFGRKKIHPLAPRIFLTIYALAIFGIYSLIPYKTPWLALNFWLAIAFLAGFAFEWIWFASPKISVRMVVLILLLALGFLIAHDTRERVFRNPADENNPYAYAHTVDDLLGLPVRLNELVAREKLSDPRIAVVAADPWPLPWYLRKWSQVGFWQPGQNCGAADFYLTSPEAAAQMTNQLQNLRPDFFGVRPNVLIILWSPEMKKPKP
ncbi:MAG TPA: flippase activity-associated protein Agl23 [Verrucomicrobiae bacterium]|nr:flippase activity-associated protein Agl23 [Verrucomicrobiae bacterium]